ncbi:uncharacterized protein LOC109020923 [Juglans regia]|uniref:Uncharacterized protein LOC109020923 n=1 Tax=Juglans regia TaxID=51240 RepID=A0A2I4HS72_JUGRE|nr:uncharacterized protein LOC109020923 [Juglans regia]
MANDVWASGLSGVQKWKRGEASAIETLEKYKQASSKENFEVQQEAILVNKSRWIHPEADFVKVNWDASLIMKLSRMGMVMIIRDEDGETLLAACDSRRNVRTPEVAKCQALWKALQVCSDLNLQKVIFEGDAKAVIMAVKCEEDDLSVVGSLIDDIRKVFKDRKDWFLQFDYREKKLCCSYIGKGCLSFN